MSNQNMRPEQLDELIANELGVDDNGNIVGTYTLHEPDTTVYPPTIRSRVQTVVITDAAIGTFKDQLNALRKSLQAQLDATAARLAQVESLRGRYDELLK